MKNATEQTAAALVQVLPQLMRFLHLGLKEHPLTLPQLRALGALADGERSAGEVAVELGIRPPTLTGLLGPLIRQGLVTRRRDRVAWRVVRLGLSPAGQDVNRSVLAAARKRVGEVVAHLSPADQVALTRAFLALGEELRRPRTVPAVVIEAAAAQARTSRGGGAQTPAQ